MATIDKLIIRLQESNFAPVIQGGNTGINAELINEVSRAIGCEGDFAKNNEFPWRDGGSNVFVALMYQNLLLTKRVLALESQALDVDQVQL